MACLTFLTGDNSLKPQQSASSTFFPELYFPTGNCLTLNPRKLNPGSTLSSLFRVCASLVLLGFNSSPMSLNHFSSSVLHSFINVVSWRTTKSSAYLDKWNRLEFVSLNGCYRVVLISNFGASSQSIPPSHVGQCLPAEVILLPLWCASVVGNSSFPSITPAFNQARICLRRVG